MAQCLPVSERVVPLPLLLLAACRFLQSLHEHPAVTSNFSVFEAHMVSQECFYLHPHIWLLMTSPQNLVCACTHMHTFTVPAPLTCNFSVSAPFES